MQRQALFCTVLLFVMCTPQARAAWPAALASYDVQLHPIGTIPDGYNLSGAGGALKIVQEKILGGGLTKEERYAIFASAGFSVYDEMRRTQATTFWFHAELRPHDESAIYDGSLGRIRLILNDGTERAPRTILATRVTQEAAMSHRGGDAPVYTLYSPGITTPEVRYADFRSESKKGPLWSAYLGFSRSFTESDIKRVVFPDGPADASATVADESSR